MDPTGLFGPLLGLVEKIVSAILGRQRVVLRAGSEKPPRRKLPPEWIGEVRALAAKPTTSRN